LTKALESDPPPEIRVDLWYLAREALKQWIMNGQRTSFDVK
jgi:hypothetical protein